MADTIIERAAAAVAEELRRQEPEHGGTYWVDADNPLATVIDGTFDLQAIARAVLAAIREDAGELAGDAYRTIVAFKGESETVIARAVFEKMIDAALAEQREP